jgi:hypothetical protein
MIYDNLLSIDDSYDYPFYGKGRGDEIERICAAIHGFAVEVPGDGSSGIPVPLDKADHIF